MMIVKYHKRIMKRIQSKRFDHVLTYTVIVMGPAYGTQASSCAYQFCQMLLATQHAIKSVFFYADGIYNANSFTSPANDEFNIVDAWQILAKRHQVTLSVCIAAAQRRGVVQELSENNIAQGFNLVGLGDLSEAINQSDRIIQF